MTYMNGTLQDKAQIQNLHWRDSEKVHKAYVTNTLQRFGKVISYCHYNTSSRRYNYNMVSVGATIYNHALNNM